MPRLMIEVTQEDLLDLKVKVDACVCGVHRSKDLSRGKLSSKISNAAGEDLERDLKSFKPDEELSHGQVREALPKKLSSQFQLIYFVNLRMWQEGNDQDLQCAIERILDDAGHKKFTSVALPTLGTGLKYPPKLVALAILQAVMAYSIDNPDSSLTCVRLSLFEQKDEMLKAFTDILTQGVNVYEALSQGQQVTTDNVPGGRDQNGNPIPAQERTKLFAQPQPVSSRRGSNMLGWIWSYFGRVPPAYTFYVGVPVSVGPYLNIRQRGLGAQMTIGVTFSVDMLPNVLTKLFNRS